MWAWLSVNGNDLYNKFDGAVSAQIRRKDDNTGD